jgi:AcrR family transcriptional regulator
LVAGPREAQIALVRRLRARRAEIDDAIFTRVSNQWFDQAGSEDPEYVAGLRAAGVAALDYVLDGIERLGASLEPVPVAALEQARRAARRGVGLDTVLRRYLAGYAVLQGFVMQEAGHDERDLIRPTEASALREVLQRLSALVDRLIAAVSSAYGKEVKRSGEPAPRSEDSAPSRPGKSAGERAGPDGCGASPASVAEVQRAHSTQRERVLCAMVELAGERGFAGCSVEAVIARAGVSRRTFYEQFDGLQACFLAVLDLGAETVTGLVSGAFVGRESWLAGLRHALASLLVFFDSEPVLARVWLVESMAAGSWAFEHRERRLGDLLRVISEAWPAPASIQPRPLMMEGVFASVRSIVVARVLGDARDDEGSLLGLLGPLMGLIAGSFLGPSAAEVEIARGEALAQEIQAGRVWPLPGPPGPGIEIPALVAHPSARRARQCLLFLTQNPGASNGQIAVAIGVIHQGQISTLLARLHDLGLLVKHAGAPGRPNAWSLTAEGSQVARALEDYSDRLPFT